MGKKGQRVNDSRYWSYVGDAVGEARRVRRDVRRFLEGQADVGRSDLDGAEPPMLCVVDRGRGMRSVYPAPGPDSENGRGLLIVRALAGEIVIDSAADDVTGTRVVVALPVHRREGPRAAA